MRLLIKMVSPLEQFISYDNYVKLQGFIYDEILSKTHFSELHNLRGPKFFSYSNVFPTGTIKSGQQLNFIFASPFNPMIEEVSMVMHNVAGRTFHAGSISFVISAFSKIITIVNGQRLILRSGTPISLRLSDKSPSYSRVPVQLRKEHFLYWRKELPVDIFTELIEKNMLKKYNRFYNSDLEVGHFIDSVSLIEADVIITTNENGRVQKIPGSLWELEMIVASPEMKKVLEFAIDAGLGERNSMGLGFVNPVAGAYQKFIRNHS